VLAISVGSLDQSESTFRAFAHAPRHARERIAVQITNGVGEVGLD